MVQTILPVTDNYRNERSDCVHMYISMDQESTSNILQGD
jgi:hypothetical protein